MASVPGGMVPLAMRLRAEGMAGYRRLVSKEGRGGVRVVFAVRDDAREFIESISGIPEDALRKDRKALTEMLTRISAGKEDTRPLTAEEFGYLTHCLGHGAWTRGLAVLREE